MRAPVAGVDGNWACSACNNVNFASRDACNRCATPKPTYDQTWRTVSKNGHAHGGPKRGPPVAGVDGNWECLACGNVNFASRDACNLCQTPRQQHQEQPHWGQPTWEQPMQKRGRPVAGVDGNWACGSCGNVNFAHRDMCNRCNNPKEQGTWEQQPEGQPTWEQPMRKRGRPVAGVDGNWACGSCGNVNFAQRTSCNRCGMLKPEERRGGRPVAGVNGNWACLSCGNVNFPERLQCNRCSALKPQEWGGDLDDHRHGRPGYGKGGRGRPMLGVDGNWLCTACHNVNYGTRMSCNRCGFAKEGGKGKAPVAGENGNWLCPACGNLNFPHRSDCNRCAAPKPEEIEDNKTGNGKMGNGTEEGAPVKKIRTS